MRFVYTLFIFFYGFFIKLAYFFNAKAAQWVSGRKDIYNQIEKALANNKKPLIWVHAASLGEFEQGRPIIEELKKKHLDYAIFLTFFSPSGYEVRKNYELADFVFYLPLDTPQNAKRFLEIVPVHLAVFIKYEYWYNYLRVIQKKKIPIIFVSAIFRKKQPFFQFYGQWFLKHLKEVDWFFVQNEESFQLLKNAGINQASLSGDTRFDRVADIASKAKENPLVERFKGKSKLLLAGSSWPEDEALIYPLMNKFPNLKIILAPHHIDNKHIVAIEKNCQEKAIRYSLVKTGNFKDKQVLIIDNFGLLSVLYRYADYTFIGGGFGAGIHNTLEAATFGMPIFIGPNYEKFQEAKDLAKLGVIQIVENANVLENKIMELQNDIKMTSRLGDVSRDYVQKNTGATEHIMKHLESNILK